MHRSETPTEIVARRVRELRRRHGWSAQKLTGEMNKAGIGWNRGVVTKLENGRRESVSVAEWLALAYVLDVSPLSLVTPENDQVTVQATPTVSITGEVLGQWIAGREPEYVGGPPFDEVDGEPFDWRRELPGWRLEELADERQRRDDEMQSSMQRSHAMIAEVGRRIRAGELPADILEGSQFQSGGIYKGGQFYPITLPGADDAGR